MPYASLGDFLVNAPLYQDVTFTGIQVRQHQSGTHYVTMPPLIDRDCPSCGPTKWGFDLGGTYADLVSERSLDHARYKCRNCQEQVFNVWFWWRRGGLPGPVFQKVGQSPKLEIAIPKEFGAALGDKRPLYVKGMTLRHNAYGIGALTYFRRVIEDTTDEMLDLLGKAMEETQADPAAIDRLKKAQAGTIFEEKVKIAGEVMPPHLRPGGVNPFGDLYDLLSIGLHDLTDEDCCEIVDAMDGALKFIYIRLKTHVAEAKVFEAAAKSLSAKVAKYKQRGSQ